MSRTILALTGSDRVDFLQGLITNDVTRADGGIVYAALLTPQGKYIADFFVVGQPDALWLDVASDLAPALAQRLTMYRLRADVQIAEADVVVSRGTSDAPAHSLADPRHSALGWRAYGSTNLSDDTDWNALHVAHVIPTSGQELTPESYILEAGFERLNGIDFRKGCYVGQEIAARMKHKTELRKGLRRVQLGGAVASGAEVSSNGKSIGQIHTIAGHQAIAYLRFDRISPDMQADGVSVTLDDPAD